MSQISTSSPLWCQVVTKLILLLLLLFYLKKEMFSCLVLIKKQKAAVSRPTGWNVQIAEGVDTNSGNSSVPFVTSHKAEIQVSYSMHFTQSRQGWFCSFDCHIFAGQHRWLNSWPKHTYQIESKLRRACSLSAWPHKYSTHPSLCCRTDTMISTASAPAIIARPGLLTVHCWSRVRSLVDCSQ